MRFIWMETWRAIPGRADAYFPSEVDDLAALALLSDPREEDGDSGEGEGDGPNACPRDPIQGMEHDNLLGEETAGFPVEVV